MDFVIRLISLLKIKGSPQYFVAFGFGTILTLTIKINFHIKFVFFASGKNSKLDMNYEKSMSPQASSQVASSTEKTDQKNNAPKHYKLNLRRFFTKENAHPYSEVEWGLRSASIGSHENKVFIDENLEFPEFWSQNAVNITASKYFRGKRGTPARERSLKQMIDRVAKTIRAWGETFGYFSNVNQAQIFEEELTYIILHQRASFNSPVWFNVGIEEKPQCSACFILSIEDTMSSILDWIKTEGMIFKGGSGAGVNLSPLRSHRESLSKGGHASGPVSFMRGADSVAGMIASGGATRRAAKMVVLNIDHPDILEFIRCKAEEEDKIRALMSAGYNMQDLNDSAWRSIQYQNANNTVRVSDEFMKAVEEDGIWETKMVKNGEAADAHKAREVLDEIAKAAWKCGDPGIQFDTTINDWHTIPNSGRINASNPCSEYMSIDNSACNLASINLLHYLKADGTFDVQAFIHTVDIFILAQEILVEGSSYPTEKIQANTRRFRQLGLGFANLGAMLMAKGLPYDSASARSTAGAVTALMCGEAYHQSARIAAIKGPFEGYEVNKEPMLKVIDKHYEAAKKIDKMGVSDDVLHESALAAWENALKLGAEHGFRNSQVTVLAPTGTISFMMDCDTTGIEPDFSLVKHKQLVGGGWMKIVNQVVPDALKRLGYNHGQVDEILGHIEKQGTIEGALHLNPDHLAVFDCAVKPATGSRYIHWQGHVRMVAAVQPFISGAISKTFNMPNETTPDEIRDSYIMAWKMGIKAFAVYRDGCKAAQPLQTSAAGKTKESEKEQLKMNLGPTRRRLPPTRSSETHKFSIAGHEGYFTYSFYEDGTLAEIFIRIAKQGSTLAGLLDAFALSVSMALQYGVPLKTLISKFIYSRFEPAGMTDNPNIRIATSITDYIFRYLALRFLSDDDLEGFGMNRVKEDDDNHEGHVHQIEAPKSLPKPAMNGMSFAGTVCRSCGGMMIRTGSCMTCLQCGNSSGGCS